MVGQLESNAKLNSKLRLKLKLELSLAIMYKIYIRRFLWMLDSSKQKVCFQYNAWIKRYETKHLCNVFTERVKHCLYYAESLGLSRNHTLLKQRGSHPLTLATPYPYFYIAAFKYRVSIKICPAVFALFL